MENLKKYKIKSCPCCHIKLDRIWFTALMTEEWTWNGHNWECSAKHNLVDDFDQDVLCPNCEQVVGTGIDFSFNNN